jgi:hypothetical protein
MQYKGIKSYGIIVWGQNVKPNINPAKWVCELHDRFITTGIM